MESGITHKLLAHVFSPLHFEHQISSSLSFPDTLGFEYRINPRTLVSIKSAANFSIGFEEFSRYAAGTNIAPVPSFGEDDGLAPVDVSSP